MIDSHNHLDLINNMIPFADGCKKNELGIFAVSTTPKAFEKEISFFSSFSNVRVGLGFHPQLIGSGYDDFELFAKLVKQSHYIGEVGLDFSRTYAVTKEKQIYYFEKVINLCESIGNKVVSIHSLRAVSTVLDIIEKDKRCNTNVYILHWFTGSLAQLRRALQIGCYFSINPKMVQTKSGQEIIKMIPQDRILIESDAPFGIDCVDAHHLWTILDNAIQDISKLKNCDMRSFIEATEQRIYRWI